MSWYCCMSATLRDYGRIGLLALRKGVLADGTSILPENWMKDATTPSPSMPGYGQSIEVYEPQNIVIVTHGLWPSAQSKELSALRTAFHEAVRDALSH